MGARVQILFPNGKAWGSSAIVKANSEASAQAGIEAASCIGCSGAGSGASSGGGTGTGLSSFWSKAHSNFTDMLICCFADIC